MWKNQDGLKRVNANVKTSQSVDSDHLNYLPLPGTQLKKFTGPALYMRISWVVSYIEAPTFSISAYDLTWTENLKSGLS